jgi:hypothetical protein
VKPGWGTNSSRPDEYSSARIAVDGGMRSQSRRRVVVLTMRCVDDDAALSGGHVREAP